MSESSGGKLPPRVIVGLGNPGERYEPTRHNLGFRVVEALARQRRISLDRQECNAVIGCDDELSLVAPQTYMNRSGYALRCLVERHQLEPSSFLVVYDELHLPLGRLRLRPGGSPAGHRGLESVLENLSTDRVPRLRLGIAGEEAPPGDQVVEFVLAPFAESEREAVDRMIERAVDACCVWVREGTETAMQKFNGSS